MGIHPQTSWKELKDFNLPHRGHTKEMKKKPSEIFESPDSSLRQVYERAIQEPPRCESCKKPMTPAYDVVAHEYSDYLWSCKKCAPNMILSIG